MRLKYNCHLPTREEEQQEKEEERKNVERKKVQRRTREKKDERKKGSVEENEKGWEASERREGNK